MYQLIAIIIVLLLIIIRIGIPNIYHLSIIAVCWILF
jgi:hypothetical protein